MLAIADPWCQFFLLILARYWLESSQTRSVKSTAMERSVSLSSRRADSTNTKKLGRCLLL
jgi:hypothetical protein